MNRIIVFLIAFCALGVLHSAHVARGEAPYNVAWSRQLGTTAADRSRAVTVDAAGNAYVTGYTYGSLGGPNAGLVDTFLTKYDPEGNLLWLRQTGMTGFDWGDAVAVDAAGNAYISGSTTSSLGSPNAGYYDAFLTKYDPTGNLVWSRQIGTEAWDNAYGVAVDSSGSAYITGRTERSLGGPSAGSSDAFLTKYDGAGNLLWSRQVGTAASEDSYDVAVDAAGNAYISGLTGGSLGGPNAGSYDAFLTKYDPTGTLVWSRQTGTTGVELSYGVAVDAAGNAYITGRTDGSLGGPNAGNDDAYLVKYDGAGNLLWSRQIGTAGIDESRGIAVDVAGNAYISGYSQGRLAGQTVGLDDAILVKYDGAGNLLWSHQIGTTALDHSNGVAVDGGGNAYIGGYTRGSLGGQNAGGDDAFLVKFAGSLPGDLDDDGDVDIHDIDTLWNVIRPEITGSQDPGDDDNEDLNSDSFVNEDDVDYMLATLLTAGPNRRYGDADLDGGIGGLDYTAWRLRAGTGWANGDFDGDGGVGGLDYALWRARSTAYPDTVGPHSGLPSAVPEPSTFALAALGLLGLVTLARRHRLPASTLGR